MDQLEGGMEEMKQMGRLLGKRVDEGQGGGQSFGSNEVPRHPPLANTTIAANDRLEEFRLSAKKIQLPAFDGSNLVAWITRVETYFEVQRTLEDVRIHLAKLSMEGHTIH